MLRSAIALKHQADQVAEEPVDAQAARHRAGAADHTCVMLLVSMHQSQPREKVNSSSPQVPLAMQRTWMTASIGRTKTYVSTPCRAVGP